MLCRLTLADKLDDILVGPYISHAGVAVSSMMFGTTVLIYMVMLMIWETNFFLATAFLISFGFIDMVFTTGKDVIVQCSKCSVMHVGLLCVRPAVHDSHR